MQRVLPVLFVLGLVLGAAPFVTPATATDPDEAVLARQAVLKDMGKTMKELGEISKGDIESQRDALVAAAAKMRGMSAKPWDYFGQETSVARVKTEAKSAIWADPAGFRKAQDDFMAATDALVIVAAKGDAKTVVEKIGALGTSCGNCHKPFKN